MTEVPQPETNAHRQARHLAMLAELGNIAMDFAREAARQGIENPDDPKHSLAFTRLANTTKQLIALEAKIATPPKRDRPDNPDDHATPPAHNPERARVGRIVRENAKRAIDGPTLKHINRYLETRLEAPDVDQAIHSTQPIGVIARTICQELSIPFDLAQQPDDVIRPRPKPPEPTPPDS